MLSPVPSSQPSSQKDRKPVRPAGPPSHPPGRRPPGQLTAAASSSVGTGNLINKTLTCNLGGECYHEVNKRTILIAVFNKL